jgi:hypothetical protein
LAEISRVVVKFALMLRWRAKTTTPRVKCAQTSGSGLGAAATAPATPSLRLLAGCPPAATAVVREVRVFTSGIPPFLAITAISETIYRIATIHVIVSTLGAAIDAAHLGVRQGNFARDRSPDGHSQSQH